MWLSASDTSDGRWPPPDAPQLAMARILRASCLLSLLLAGFVPPGRGQEKSKVSEPSGLKRSPWHPGVHCATGRATASPEAPRTPLVTLCLCALTTQTRVLQRAVVTQEGSLSRVYTFSSSHLGIAGSHNPENIAGEKGGPMASSLIPGRWRQRSVTGRILTWGHIPFWASVSPSVGGSWRGWLEGYGILQLPSLIAAHWPATHGADTVAREANPGQEVFWSMSILV